MGTDRPVERIRQNQGAMWKERRGRIVRVSFDTNGGPPKGLTVIDDSNDRVTANRIIPK